MTEDFRFNKNQRLERGNDVYEVVGFDKENDLYVLWNAASKYTMHTPRTKVEREFFALAKTAAEESNEAFNTVVREIEKKRQILHERLGASYKDLDKEEVKDWFEKLSTEAKKMRPFFETRDNLLIYVSVLKKILSDMEEGSLETHGVTISKEVLDKLNISIQEMQRALFGVKDTWGDTIEDPLPLADLGAVQESFSNVSYSLPSDFYRLFKSKVKEEQLNYQEDRINNFIKAYITKQLLKIYVPELSLTPIRKRFPPINPEFKPQKPFESINIKPEEGKGKPIAPPEFPEVKEKPGIKRLPSPSELEETKEKRLKVWPVLSEFIQGWGDGPRQRITRQGGERVDNILWVLDKDLSEEEFVEEARRSLTNRFKADPEELQKKIDEKTKRLVMYQEDEEDPISKRKARNLATDISSLKMQIEDINHALENLKFLYRNWI